MSATANKDFDIQHQTLSSLRHVHQVCMGLEALQVFASIIVLSFGFFPPQAVGPFFLRVASMAYFFIAIFAHVVVYYVLITIRKNVKSPGARTLDRGLLFTLLPLIVLHALLILVSVAGLVPNRHLIDAATLVSGIVCVVRILFALRSNTRFVQSFVLRRPSPEAF